jgi:hypothetical protein
VCRLRRNDSVEGDVEWLCRDKEWFCKEREWLRLVSTNGCANSWNNSVEGGGMVV